MATYPIPPFSSLNVDGAVTAGQGVFVNGAINSIAAAAALAGTTAGSALYQQDFQGTVKRMVVALDGYENTTATAQVIDFPVPFSVAAEIVLQPTSFGATVSKTALTLPASMAAAVTGVIVIEGM